MVSTIRYHRRGLRSFPGRAGCILAFVKNLYMRETEGLILLFCRRNNLIVGGWVVFPWSRKSYLWPAEIAFSVLLVLFKDGGRNVSPKLITFLM